MTAAGQGMIQMLMMQISDHFDEEPMAEKTSPRSDLRWKPTGRIFKSVGLRWIPTGKLFDSCTSKVDSEPPHGSNVDIPHIHACKQTLDVSAGTSINVQKEQSLDLSTDPPPLNIHSTHQTPTQVPTVSAPENIIQAETNTKNAQFDDDEFINIFSTLVQEQGETSSCHVDSTRRQLETDGEMCMFALTVELHQFDRLDVWELVDRPLCKYIININWLWKNKRDEENTVIRNKSCLVAKDMLKGELIFRRKSFTPVA
ncbi:hypothetical protein Tco_1184066 [Tanacetum coccineum]